MDRWISALAKGLLLLGAGLLLAGEALAGARIALVVGVDDYRGSRSVGLQGVTALPDLKLASADARSMASKLRSLGFTVDLLDQPGARVTAERLVDAVEGFAGKLKSGRGEVALFYFAGHGVQGAPGSVADREGLWLLPGDADLTKGDVSARSAKALAFTEIELRFREAGTDRWTAPVIVLDACRNELPAAGSRSATRSRGLQMPQLSAGALVAFATASGELAFEPDGAANGLYTSLLLEELGRPGRSLADAFLNAQSRARDDRRYRQQPELVIKGGRPQTVFLAGAAAPAITPTDPAAIELAFWQSTERVNTVEAYRAYLERYPGGQFAALAGLKLRPVAPLPAQGSSRNCVLEDYKVPEGMSDPADYDRDGIVCCEEQQRFQKSIMDRIRIQAERSPD